MQKNTLAQREKSIPFSFWTIEYIVLQQKMEDRKSLLLSLFLFIEVLSEHGEQS